MSTEGKAWNVLKVEKEEYASHTIALKNAFNRADFCELNKNKVDEIQYLLIRKGESGRFALPVGLRGKEAFCPFSAPFSYPEEIKSGLGVDNYSEAGKVLDEYFAERGLTKATFVFPPSFYDKKALETWLNIFFYLNWRIETIDLSFGFHISDIVEDYEKKIAYNAKKNYRIAQNAGLLFHSCETLAEKKEAFRVISVNRASKGYPLRMTEEQVLKTMDIVPSEMYLVSAEEENVAAALVYTVTKSVAQVIYWGDVPGHSEKKSVNYLAYELLKIYRDKGMAYLDIGPSTENGVPNFGLCDFKDSIGCERSTKFRLVKEY